MSQLRQRWRTKYQTDKTLIIATKQELTNLFPYISDIYITEGYCCFTITNIKFDSFRHNTEPIKNSCAIIDIEALTDEEIVILARTNPIELAQEIHSYLLNSVFN